MKKTLEQLYAEHAGKVSDKWSIYLAEYDRIFEPYRDKPVSMLEIGVQNGGSLEIWSKFFLHAENLVGCDINADCAKLIYNDPRISVVVGDANTDAAEVALERFSKTFDIVIDDGSHKSGDIVKSFARYFPRLRDGGVFVAEDLHCSYWQEFEGGLFDPMASMTFFKRLADIVNHEHWGAQKFRSGVLNGFFDKYGCVVDEESLAHIHSVEFINSMCVIKRRAAKDNVLGRRVIAGSAADIVPQVAQLSGLKSLALPQDGNRWTQLNMPPDEEQPLLTAELDLQRVEMAQLRAQLELRSQQLEQKSQQLEQQSQQLEHQGQRLAIFGHTLELMQNSRSWRLTTPLRQAGQWARHVKRGLSLVPVAIHKSGGLSQAARKAAHLYRREGWSGLKRGLHFVKGAGQLAPVAGSDAFDRNDYVEWVRRYDTMTDDQRAALREKVAAVPAKPLISVVMPTYNPKPEWLIEAIESVRRQIYPNWELCIADDASPNPEVRPILERYAREDGRVKVVFRSQNGHISAASNSALELASGEWVALLDHDDVLPEHALFYVAEAILSNPDARLIYSDEDKIDAMGHRSSPYFKCDWNPDLFYSQNMFCHLGVYHKPLLDKVEGFRIGFEGSQDYDLTLRCIEQIPATAIHHIPRVLYHWRMHTESTAGGAEAKPYAMLAGERAINEHFQRTGVAGKVELVGVGYRAHYDLPEDPPLVSLIIPTRNGLQLLKQCIDSIVEKTTYSNYEIIVIDNGSDDPEILRYFENVVANRKIHVLRDERPFNYSALNNLAAREARGDILGLLNNDVEVITSEWLSEMVSHALRPGVGAVGARLLYSNGNLQHGGVVLGVGGVAGHSHKHMPRHWHGYFGRLKLVSTYSAVTAACLVIKKSTYFQVDGLNEKDLTVAFNDVDFCLRVRELGYRNVWTPFAELYHHESATRGYEDTPEKQARFAKEVQYMKQRWGDRLRSDPAYSPNLTLDHEDFSLSWPPRVSVI